MFSLPEMSFNICDVISLYKLTHSKHILIVSLRVGSNQSQGFCPISHTPNQSASTFFLDIFPSQFGCFAELQSPELVQGIYVQIISHKLCEVIA